MDTREQIRVGDIVVCVEEAPESSAPMFTPLKKGQRYQVLGTRGADLRPAVDDRPCDIKIYPDPSELSLWYHASRFRKVPPKPARPETIEHVHGKVK